MGGFIVLLLQIGFWWFLIKIIKTAASKAKKAANEQGKQGSAPAAQPVSKPAAQPVSKPAAAPKPATVSKRLQQDDHARRTAPVTPRPKPAVVTEGNPKPHVVAPSFGKKHAHTESSMTGFEDCAPELSHVEPAAEAETLESSELSFAGKDIIKAMVYSEILSKPKALR